MSTLVAGTYRGARMAALTGPAGRLLALEVDGPSPARLGSIHRGIVRNTTPAGTFFDLGACGEGFLDAAKGATLPPSGQSLPVQVKAEAFGKKSPALSTAISLPGRFCIHTPRDSGIHLSRRAKDSQACAHAKAALEKSGLPGGFIIRARAEKAAPEALLAEAAFLARLGEAVLCGGKTFSGMTAPMRIIADAGDDPETIILCGRHDDFETWLSGLAPGLADRISREDAADALLDSLGLCEGIDALLAKEVPLDGGSLVIEQTEALVAIDVNSGSFEGGRLAVSIAAAKEIARQVRLRNLSGMIVMDFPRLSSRADEQRVMDTLATASEGDPCAFSIAGYSPLHLLEGTRTRKTPPLSGCMT